MEYKMVAFSHIDKLRFAQAFFNYWFVKEKAVELGRLKSCRRLKAMDLTTVSSFDQSYIINNRLDKIKTVYVKEHYSNIKHMILQEPTISENCEVSVDARGGVIIRIEQKNKVILDVVRYNSNLPLDLLQPHFLLSDNGTSFRFNCESLQKRFINNAALVEDYVKILDWIRRYKNTILLIDRLHPKFPNLRAQLFWARRDGAKIEFTGVTNENCSVESILESAFIAIDSDGKVRRQQGKKVKPSLIPVTRTRQQILNDYVTNVIIPQRRSSTT